jgi:hypothetical protein
MLGQNVLGRLGAWSIDNRRSVLMRGERPPNDPAEVVETHPGRALRDH